MTEISSLLNNLLELIVDFLQTAFIDTVSQFGNIISLLIPL
jgi:hypothetical protein